MNPSPRPDQSQKFDASLDTGVADVRLVREKISALYNGDLRAHVAQTHQLVAPLIAKLGLNEGVPAPKSNRRSGTEG